MRGGTSLLAALLAALLAVAVADAEGSAAELFLSTDDVSIPLAVLSAGLEIGDELTLGDAGALGWSIGASGSVIPADAAMSGGASLRLEASRSWSAIVLGADVAGSLSASSAAGAGPIVGRVAASLRFDGETVGVSLEPSVELQWLVAPHLGAGMAVRVPVLVGSVVLEPAVSAGAQLAQDASVTLELEPALGISWYPGIPLTVTAGGKWTGTVEPAGALDAAWTGTASLAGALGDAVFLTASVSLYGEAEGIALDAWAEMELVLGEPAGGELVLPLRLDVSLDPADGVTTGAGMGLRYSW